MDKLAGGADMTIVASVVPLGIIGMISCVFFFNYLFEVFLLVVWSIQK